MRNILQVAITLTAYDRMSRVVAQASRASQNHLRALSEKSNALFGQGGALLGAGTAGALSLAPAVRAFATLENSAASLQSAMMQAGGTIAPEFEAINALAVKLGNQLPGTTADLQSMMTELIQNGIQGKDVLAGVGTSAAQLAIALKMPYNEAANFAAKLKVSTGTASADMVKFMDVIQRTRNLGVETTEMGYAFGRTGLKQFGLGGLENAKSFAALFATILPITKSGETTGTGVSKLMSAMFDAGKMKAANAELSKFGMSWDFVDQKTGKFLGVENLVGQLGKLSGLSDSQRLNVLTKIFGEGEDRKIAAIIAANGVAGYNEAVKRMAAQGSLEQKVGLQTRTLANLWESLTGTMENAWAAFGAAFAPEMKKITTALGNGAAWLQKFAAEHPKLFKFVALSTALVSGILMVAGAVKIVQGAFLLLRTAMLANPVTLILTGIAVAAALIYTYWDDIAGFFARIWAKIKSVVSGVWTWFKTNVLDTKIVRAYFGFWKAIVTLVWTVMKGIGAAVWKGLKWVWNLFLDYTPVGGLIKNWSKIVAAAQVIFEKVKQPIVAAWEWMKGVGKMFYDAGANIINSIVDGITGGIKRVTDAIGWVTTKVREYLPFSPAKAGAFKDLHRVRIVETIAGTIRPQPMVAAMSRATAQTARVGGNITPQRNGGGVSVIYSPTLNFSGEVAPGTRSEFLRQLEVHKTDVARMVNDANQRAARKKY